LCCKLGQEHYLVRNARPLPVPANAVARLPFVLFHLKKKRSNMMERERDGPRKLDLNENH